MTVYGLFAIEKKRYRYNTKFVMKIMRNEIKNKIDSVKFLQKIGVTPYTHCPVHPCHKFWSPPYVCIVFKYLKYLFQKNGKLASLQCDTISVYAVSN